VKQTSTLVLQRKVYKPVRGRETRPAIAYRPHWHSAYLALTSVWTHLIGRRTHHRWKRSWLDDQRHCKKIETHECNVMIQNKCWISLLLHMLCLKLSLLCMKHTKSLYKTLELVGIILKPKTNVGALTTIVSIKHWIPILQKKW